MASLLLFTLFALLCATVRAEGDYFLFVRQWDPTVCKVGKCSHTPGCRFTIHGLWPQYFNDTWPKFCTGEGFDPALVADLEPVLRREWPSVFSSNKAFWKHEWRKHGTCAESLCPLLSDEHSFFFAVLALNKMYDLNTVMNEAHIELETPHEQLWVEQMFEDTFKHGLAIHCYHEHHKSHGQSQEAVPIFEVWMCFDKQLQPFDCPANVRRRCHGNVIFPASDPGGAELLALSSQAASTINPGSSYQHSRMAITPQDTFDNNDDDHDTESTHGIMQALEELVTPGVPVIDAIREFQQRRDEFETN